MATFALIHGAGDVGWYWHLVVAELRRRGHQAVAPDLPCDDDSAGPTCSSATRLYFEGPGSTIKAETTPTTRPETSR